jgi:lipopolysaccharide export system permease protein
LEILQAIHTHFSLPWAALGFVLIGIPLGLRPVRATTGIGLGLSLVIVFAYYVIFQTMNLIGEQGVLPPAFTAWFPNVMLLGVGVSLLMSARR